MSSNKTSQQNSAPVDNPHDKLIRRLLSNVATAKDLLETYLPPEIIALVDLNFLERQPDTFVDAEHRMKEVDVLFKTRYKGSDDELFVWVLIEQQRDPDVWLPLRLFVYTGVIWDHFRKSLKTRSKSSKIPFIYPLIISNASAPYKHSLTLRDMIEPANARPLFDKLFKTPVQLIDLAAIPDEELRASLQQRVHAQALLLSLKHVFDKNLQEYLETVLWHAFKTLDKLGYSDDVADLLYYLYNEGNLNDPTKFWAFLHQKFSKGVEEKVMTLGQQAIQQAKNQAFQEGAQQGAQQKARETAILMIKKNSDPAFIAQVTGLPLRTIKELQKEQTTK